MKTLEFFIGKFHDLAKQCQIVEASHQIESAKGSFVRLPYKPILAHSYSSQLNLGLEF